LAESEVVESPVSKSPDGAAASRLKVVSPMSKRLVLKEARLPLALLMTAKWGEGGGG